MFILSLRGQLGILIALALHGLTAVMTFAVIGSSVIAVQLAGLAVFGLGVVFVLRHMNENRARLQFNSAVNAQLAYPTTSKVEKATAYLQGALCLIFFLPVAFLRLIDMPLPEVPTGVLALPFYLGALCFIGVLQTILRGRAA